MIAALGLPAATASRETPVSYSEATTRADELPASSRITV
jgi:hypothetical protein